MNERYLLIGTAGHVDHGKTQLIQTLTGISTDRLKEEKERGISIELGFAHLVLPDGRKAGIVDVPGHEKFVRQMLAGASGMDVVLLVIAADEGVMPQTKEHLEILNILRINKGIVVLTKIDLVDDEWLTMIEQDIREKLKGSFMEKAAICRVSARTALGIPQLLQTIIAVLDDMKSRRLDLPARMPVDRIFSIQGFGTVVTGTLSSGMMQKGQDVCLQPGGLTCKVRNIQVHADQVDQAFAGQRVAINLTGLAVCDIEKGSNLVPLGQFDSGQILDVELFNLPAEKRAIKHRQRIHFYLGTAEKTGRIHLLNQEEVAPGETALAQIMLDEPVMMVYGERFVIRYYSPVATIGGGTVLGLASHKRKRFKEKVIEELKLKAEGNPSDLIFKEIFNPCTLNELVKRTKLSKDEIQGVLKAFAAENLVVQIKEDTDVLYWKRSSAEQWGQSVGLAAVKYQQENPLRAGISREELKKKLKIEFSPRRWQHILEWCAAHGYILLKGNNIEAWPIIDLPEKIEKQLDCLKNLWEEEGLNPPDLEEGASSCEIPAEKVKEYASYLVLKGIWLQIGSSYFSAMKIDQAKGTLIKYIQERGKISVAEARDLWNTSRKYAVPILEYFDSVRLTKRNESERTLY